MTKENWKLINIGVKVVGVLVNEVIEFKENHKSSSGSDKRDDDDDDDDWNSIGRRNRR